MKLKKSTDLSIASFLLLAAVGLNLIVLVFVLTIMTSRVGMEYGYELKPVSSRYVINSAQDMFFVSVSAGEPPEIFIDNKRIAGGLAGLSGERDHLNKDAKGTSSERITIAQIGRAHV